MIFFLSLCSAIVKPDIPFSQGNLMAATALKPKAYPGVQLLAAASIEANSVEEALRGAQYRSAPLILLSFSPD